MHTKDNEITDTTLENGVFSLGDTAAFPLTELGNAERLVHRFGDHLRYSSALGWLVWDGKRWATDDNSEQISRWYFYIVRDLAVQAGDIRQEAKQLEVQDRDGNQERIIALRRRAGTLAAWAKECETNYRRRATLAIAETLLGVSVRHNQLDTHPWLLNVQNGTIDLRTGQLKPHDPADLLTRICPVAYRPDALCPLWENCLTRWQPGTNDPNALWKNGEKGEKPEDVRVFLQRAAGYTLTGFTREHTAFFLYGGGGNGKSVFTNTLERLMGHVADGGYSVRIPFTALADERRSGGVTPELVNLVGARFVISSEPAANQRFDDARIKDLCSSDTITVNPKYKEQFQFEQTHKLWIYGNHKPRLNTVDDGIKRRLPLIPFTVTITEEERDDALEAKLQEEAEGILAWAVRGCLAWQERGLSVPPSVLEATTDYHAENDPFSGFFEARTVWKAGLNATISEIMEAYKSFAGSGDDLRIPHLNAFAERLRQRGAENKVIRRGGKQVRCWVGIGITDGDDSDDWFGNDGGGTTPDDTAPKTGDNHRPVTPVTPVTPKKQNSAIRTHAPIQDFTNSAVTDVTAVTEERKKENKREENLLKPPALPLLPVVFTQEAVGKGFAIEWKVTCRDPDAPPGTAGAGEGFGDTKNVAIENALQDPFQTPRQRAALEAAYRMEKNTMVPEGANP